jgi:hypothetical protein
VGYQPTKGEDAEAPATAGLGRPRALRAEWAIESVILDMLKELKMTFVLLYVKSHQGNDTPTVNLTLETRLNVEAGLR